MRLVCLVSLLATAAASTIKHAKIRTRAIDDYGNIPTTSDYVPPGGFPDTTWSDPSDWVEIDVTKNSLPVDYDSIDASVAIADILDTVSTSSRRVLVFPAGTYYFNSTLKIRSSDVILRGAGLSKTTFLITANGSANAEIRFDGSWTAEGRPVDGSVSPGATSVNVSDASDIEVGQMVQLYLNAGRQAWGTFIESQLLLVKSVSGNRLTFDFPVDLTYSEKKEPYIRPIDALFNVGGLHIEGVRIERVNEPAAQDVSNVAFRMASNVFDTDNHSINSGRSHADIALVLGMVVERNYAHGFYINKGGYGYGFNVHLSTGVRVTDNKTWDLRHHILLQQGANHNVISYNAIEEPWQSYNDMAFHASYAYFNLIEGNTFYEDCADNSHDNADQGKPFITSLSGHQE
ncbi:pectin lyase fold/virulence factor [Desarmillaria tabescens]|uniref:Pectin lyase fold/virulence factor n=1 Tax=Armillaria tabescens TaxID=1929756 RepID=A0AA39NCK1_ARMTA|nr:pectin lyase fold/virulence factor [Desarmillaria tabescens]KAK0463054.1 pectin lyase fold/virulence factor [Desarmillaria tabescens]